MSGKLIARTFAPALRGQRPAGAASSLAARHVSTAPLSKEENLALLNKQRNLRPSSPHFTIYQPQLTWISSIFNRGTGVGMSVGLYALFLGHLALPAFGVPFDSATIVSVFASFPAWLQYSFKAIVAAPVSFHTWNGFRHLGWDLGKFIELKSSYTAGYTVLGLTALSTIGLVLL